MFSAIARWKFDFFRKTLSRCRVQLIQAYNIRFATCARADELNGLDHSWVWNCIKMADLHCFQLCFRSKCTSEARTCRRSIYQMAHTAQSNYRVDWRIAFPSLIRICGSKGIYWLFMMTFMLLACEYHAYDAVLTQRTKCTAGNLRRLLRQPTATENYAVTVNDVHGRVYTMNWIDCNFACHRKLL